MLKHKHLKDKIYFDFFNNLIIYLIITYGCNIKIVKNSKLNKLTYD